MRNRGALLGSVMLIVLASMLVGAGTFAWFSDVETSSGNYVKAGTLDLKVDGKDDPIGVLIEFKPLVSPGMDGNPEEWIIVLTNDGSMPGIANLHFKDVTDYDDGVSSEPEAVADPDSTIFDISNYVKVKVFWDPTGYEFPTKTLRQYDCVSFDLGHLGPGASANLKIILELDYASIGNAYQGDYCTFSIEFSLKQY